MKYDAILVKNDVIDHEVMNVIEIKIQATFLFKSIQYFYGLFESFQRNFELFIV